MFTLIEPAPFLPGSRKIVLSGNSEDVIACFRLEYNELKLYLTNPSTLIFYLSLYIMLIS